MNTMPLDEDIDVRKIRLEKFKAVACHYISKELMNDFALEPKVDVTELAEHLVVTVRQFIYGCDVEKIECRYPENWWEAVKERFLPKWAKKRWPIKYVVKELVARELYPKISLPYQEAAITLLERTPYD